MRALFVRIQVVQPLQSRQLVHEAVGVGLKAAEERKVGVGLRARHVAAVELDRKEQALAFVETAKECGSQEYVTSSVGR